MPSKDVNQLKITMAEFKKDIGSLSDKLSTHIADQKESDKRVADNFKEVIGKIDSFIEGASDKFVERKGYQEEIKNIKENHNFWRNILVGGLILTIAVGIINSFFK